MGPSATGGDVVAPQRRPPSRGHDRVTYPPNRSRWYVRIGLDRGLRREGHMGRQRYTPEQMIGKLREGEVAMAKGQTVVEMVRALGITEQTDARWRPEYGG